MVRDLWHRLRALFRLTALERDLDDELQFHLDRAIERHQRAGLPLEDATRRARLELGGLDQVRESCRDERGIGAIERARQDVRFALRVLRKSPAFTVIVVGVLALGIGATATAFAMLDGLLLKPLPYRDAGQLVQLGTQFGSISVSAVSIPDLEAIAARAQTLPSVGASRTRMSDVTGTAMPERIATAVVSAGFFETLGVAPAVGRTFDASSDRRGAPPVVVLADGFWRSRFGAAPDVIGTPLVIDGVAHTIVGVMPRSFRGPDALSQADTAAWVPLGTSRPAKEDRDDAAWGALARLTGNASAERAAAELDAIGETIGREIPGAGRRRFWASPLRDRTTGDSGSELWLLFAAVGALFTIACSNIAGLFLVRATERGREMVVRAALGATGARIARQLFAESLMVTAAGGAIGIALAAIGIGAFKRLASPQLPRLADVALDARVIGFAIGITAVVAVAFGLAPAIQASRVGLAAVLRHTTTSLTGSRLHTRGRHLLVVVQMALALVLLVGAALLVNSFVRLSRVDPGFDARQVVWLDVTLPARYKDARSRLAFYETLLPAVRASTGTIAAGAISGRPLGAGSAVATMHPSESVPANEADVRRFPFQVVAPGYFAALGIPLIDGRDVRDDDRANAPAVAVVSRSFASQFWPGERAVGKQFWLGRIAADAPLIEVVGVAEDVRHFGLSRTPEPIVYRPLAQAPVPRATITVVVRHDGGAEHALTQLREAVRGVDAGLALNRGGTMEDAVSASIAEPRARMLALTVFAAIAALVSGVGLYATLSWIVRSRRREIGIRVVLGAAPNAVRRLVVRRAIGLTLAGLTLGAIGSLWASQLLASIVFGVSIRDVPTFVAAAVVLAAVAALACWMPARRAATIDPVETLRVE